VLPTESHYPTVVREALSPVLRAKRSLDGIHRTPTKMLGEIDIALSRGSS
jgi:hypothetical protein